jgi:glyoxylase I family protein
LSNPSGITGIHHVAVFARRSYDEAVRFYAEVLLLPRKVEFVVGNKRASLFDTGNAGYVEVFDYTGQPAEAAPTTINHFALRTKDVDGVLKRVRAAGVRVTVEPVSFDFPTHHGPASYSIRIAFFDGPEGESIELFDEVTEVP